MSFSTCSMCCFSMGNFFVDYGGGCMNIVSTNDLTFLSVSLIALHALHVLICVMCDDSAIFYAQVF